MLHSSKFNGYVRAGVGQVESFAIATCGPASAYFDAVLAAGLEPGPPTEFTAQLFFKEIWFGGLQLAVEDIRLSPRLLSRMAQYAVGKKACIKAVIKLLPELCQVGCHGLFPPLLAAPQTPPTSSRHRYQWQLSADWHVRNTHLPKNAFCF